MQFFFDDLAPAGGYHPREWSKDGHRYFHISMGIPGASGRLTRTQAKAIPGFWVDIDTIDGHSNSNNGKKYPKTKQEAIKILNGCGTYPTIIVDTGGGIHAYWCFNELWIFETDEERDKAEHLSKLWQIFIRKIFNRHGYTVDSTHDLARILRLPGHDNPKYTPPRPVTYQVVGPYYELTELIDILDANKIKDSDKINTKNNNLPTLDVHANPPIEKFQLLYDINQRFAQSWDGRRVDLKDQSASGYSLSLASMAAFAKWEDDEIIALVIAFRRKNNFKLNIDRPEWYQNLIKVARSGIEIGDNEDKIIERFTNEEGESSTEKVSAIQKLAYDTGIPIIAIEQHGETQPIYILKLEDDTQIELGSVQNLLSYTKFQAKIFETKRIFPRVLKKGEWPKLISAIGPEIQVIAQKDTDPAYQILDWLSLYANSCRLERDTAARQGKSFSDDGKFHIHADDFKSWLDFKFGKPLNSTQLRQRLKLVGCEPEKIAYTKSAESKNFRQRRYWVLVLPSEIPTDHPLE